MINSVKQAIVDELLATYPKHTIYDEDVPQKFKKPSFIVTLIEQDYEKRINVKFKSVVSFDVAYFSPKGASETKSDCLEVQLKLLRDFDLIGGYRVLNKQVKIVDNVLHFTFNIKYSEINSREYIKMRQARINERMEG